MRRKFSQGLYPAAAKCGLERSRAVKDYRRVLDRADVDFVCISTPDHWHARMTLDALAAGKDAFVETPMTRTSAEAAAVVAMADRTGRVVGVGHANLANPDWSTARDAIRRGAIGPAVHASAGVFRSDARGYWRFYRIVPEMTARSIDWPLFLGHTFEVNGEPLSPGPRPFDRAAFAQWRCDAAFSTGPFADMLAHPAAKLLAALGLRSPARVLGAGGLFHERDGRTVPDVATLAADFAEGTHLLLTASTAANFPADDIIRGRRGAIRFARGGLELFREGPQAAPERLVVESPKHETDALWENFLRCVRSRDRATLAPPELGAAVASLVAEGASRCRGAAV